MLLCLLFAKLALFSRQQENCPVNTQAVPSWVVMPETLALIQPEPMAAIAMFHPDTASLSLDQRVSPYHWSL